jgi:hypothetical protein
MNSVHNFTSTFFKTPLTLCFHLTLSLSNRLFPSSHPTKRYEVFNARRNLFLPQIMINNNSIPKHVVTFLYVRNCPFPLLRVAIFSVVKLLLISLRLSVSHLLAPITSFYRKSIENSSATFSCMSRSAEDASKSFKM